MSYYRVYTFMLLGLGLLLSAPVQAIQAAFTATQSPSNPLVFKLDAGDSDPGTGAYITKYEWTSAGVSIPAGRTSQVDFTALGSASYGSHDITLTVTNSASPVATSSATKTVVVYNDRAVASFSYVVNGSEVKLNGSPSYSAGSGISSYRWSVVPASRVVSQDPVGASASAQATIVFDQAGSYSINLTVTDASGRQAIQVQTVSVNQVAPPVAQMTSLPSLSKVYAPATVSFDGSASSSGVGVRYYLWSVKNTQGEVVFFADSATKIAQYHFTEPGSYDVTLEIIDNKGRSASITRSANVVDPVAPVLGTALLKVPGDANTPPATGITGNFSGGVLYQNAQQQGEFLAANAYLPSQPVSIVASLPNVDPSHQGQPVDLLAILIAPNGSAYARTSSELVPFTPFTYTGNASVLAADYAVPLRKGLRFEIASGTLDRLAAGTYQVWPAYRLRQAVGEDAANTIFLSQQRISFRKN